MNENPPIVLVFAAADSSGGGGLSADILTLASMGCHPLPVITGLAVQDTIGVEALMGVDPDWVADQARCVLEDMPVAAFKLGLLGSVENVAAIAEVVSDYPDVPLVFDPVLTAGSGDEYASDELIKAIREMLLPQTTILTPNRGEARRLACVEAEDDDEDGDQRHARRLLGFGCEFVLITGTHTNTPKVINTLYGDAGVIRSDRWERLPGAFHGAGCTLASAIAATLANGLAMEDAVRDAQEYTWQSLKSAFRLGMGQHVPDRLFWARDKSEEHED